MESSSKVLFLACLVSVGYGQFAENFMSHNSCSAKATCSECIQNKSCAWCYEPNYVGERCFQPHQISTDGGCSEQYINDPDNLLVVKEKMELTRVRGKGGMVKDGAFMTSSSGSFYSSTWAVFLSSVSTSKSVNRTANARVVQVSPQKLDLRLRINDVYKLSVSYSQAEDYPVDLYYLMDLSKSMADDKEKLNALGDLLSESLKNITSNFRLGFGTFVDKVSTAPKNGTESCTNCTASYVYHNIMPLSKDIAKFKEGVRNVAVSGNLDSPEISFDAILQAIVCHHQIGWRVNARRLLMFSTDAGFSHAEDGKLGGMVEPNDGLCHLDHRDMYTYSTLQDHPSISQINLKVQQYAVNIIFAIATEQVGVYEKIVKHIEGATFGVLSQDSSNIISLVEDQYNKISSSIEMKDNTTSPVQIQYYSSCLGNGVAMPTNKCYGLKVGDVIEFYAEIMVTHCPKNPAQWNQMFKIYPVGIKESLLINLEMICDCPCEKQGHYNYEEHSPRCNNVGTYTCGVCMCGANYYGRNCECHGNETSNVCRLPGYSSDFKCSGRGNCHCGQCECDKRPDPDEKIYGAYCECDNFSCDRHDGLLCSGPTNGQCECGQCVCKEGWSGSACACRTTNKTCIPPIGGEICSSHGECVCGRCICDLSNVSPYYGRYCNKCPTCPDRCAEFKNCVQCKMYQTGPLNEEDCERNCTFEPVHVDTIFLNEETDEDLCAGYDEEGCRFAYVYAYDEKGHVTIRATHQRICPPQD